jgi:nucleoside-diphosphate-sugar epimerase
MPAPYRIAVTGAAGFIGRHLVAALSSRGHHVIAIGRRRVPDFLPLVKQAVIDDLSGSTDWATFLKGADVVVHLAGIAHATGHVPAAAYNQVNHLATAALASAANRLGVRLIFVSSVAAQVAPSANGIVTEHDPATPASTYGRSKREAEQAIATASHQYVILRPTLVYGPGVKANMAKLLQLAKLPAPLPFASINNRRSLLSIDNFIHAIDFLIAHEDVNKQIFLIADPEPVSLPEIISLIREGMGRSPNLIPVSAKALAVTFSLLNRSDMWERLSGNLVVSIEHLRRAGYSPLESTREGLIRLGRIAVGRQP